MQRSSVVKNDTVARLQPDVKDHVRIIQNLFKGLKCLVKVIQSISSSLLLYQNGINWALERWRIENVQICGGL